MIPIRDKNPSGVTPWLVYGLIAANVLVFLYETSLPKGHIQGFFDRFGLVPARITQSLATGDPGPAEAFIVPTFTYMFLHGGWLHLIGNMWFLFIFGDNIEARIGRGRFVLFYALCGLAAAGLQFALSPHSTAPIVGASGAVAGVLGAYMVCWPKARVVTLVPIFYFITFIELPAVFVLGIWFVIQFFRGVGSIGAQVSGGGVAYWAHVGGFLAGVVLILLVPAVDKRRDTRRRPAQRR